MIQPRAVLPVGRAGGGIFLTGEADLTTSAWDMENILHTHI